VVYLKDDLYLLDLRNSQSTFLVRSASLFEAYGASDDLSRLIYLRDGQVHLVDAASAVDRVITGVATQAVISGDGNVVYAATDLGGLLKIKANDGEAVTLIGRTPYLQPYPIALTPGLTPIFSGSDLSRPAAVKINDAPAPLIDVTPTSLRFLVPWDATPGPARVVAEIPGDRTPFDFPEAAVTIGRSNPLAGAIARQDWTQTYVGPIKTGEIIHVFAIGLGPVSPEVQPGTAAPSAEPLPRTTQPLTCSNAEVLYAGLAPTFVERVYQVDLRIGPKAGYQQFFCTLGGSDPFIFLTLNVVE